MTKELTLLTPKTDEQLPLKQSTQQYIKAATSENTRRAYQADIRHFENWGGSLPANTGQIMAYLSEFASLLNPRTLARRLTALKNWHTYQEFNDPTAHPAIAKLLSGIMRTHGKPKDKAPPLLPEQLIQIVAHLEKQPDLRAYRDSALLQIGFCGALRRSELVNLAFEHIEWSKQGIEILIPRSKTDQTSEGQRCAIPTGGHELCAVKALKVWLAQSHIQNGPIFRRIRGDHLSIEPLTPLSVNQILKKRAKEAGMPDGMQLSSHSLRRGLATSASRDGASLPAIMRQGRWKNVNTVMEYIEAAQRFEENAMSPIFKRFSSNDADKK